jgi:hypothetical protein
MCFPPSRYQLTQVSEHGSDYLQTIIEGNIRWLFLSKLRHSDGLEYIEKPISLFSQKMAVNQV